MKHQDFRKLGRTSAHRKFLLRALALSLIKHGRIQTTLGKAKELRRYIEPIVTYARENNLHRKRIVMRKLKHFFLVKKLFEIVAPQYKETPGGYTRIYKLPEHRHGDASKLALIEFCKISNVVTGKKIDKAS